MLCARLHARLHYTNYAIADVVLTSHGLAQQSTAQHMFAQPSPACFSILKHCVLSHHTSHLVFYLCVFSLCFPSLPNQFGCNGSIRKELPMTEPWLDYTKLNPDGKSVSTGLDSGWRLQRLTLATPAFVPTTAHTHPHSKHTHVIAVCCWRFPVRSFASSRVTCISTQLPTHTHMLISPCAVVMSSQMPANKTQTVCCPGPRCV